MKRDKQTMALDKAVATIAAILEPVWSKFTPEEKAERLRNTKQFVSSARKKEHSLHRQYD